MNVYKIDTGVDHYVAAINMGQAVVLAWEFWAACDDQDVIEDAGFSVEKVPEAKWPMSYWDDGEGKHLPFSELVASTNAPGILTCSDW